MDLLAARELEALSPQSHIPYSAACCRWTWLPGQCEPWLLCPRATQSHTASLSGA
jgi:hypothetical protein